MIISLNSRLFTSIGTVRTKSPLFKSAGNQAVQDNFTPRFAQEKTAGGLSLERVLRVLKNPKQNIELSPELLVAYKY